MIIYKISEVVVKFEITLVILLLYTTSIDFLRYSKAVTNLRRGTDARPLALQNKRFYIKKNI